MTEEKLSKKLKELTKDWKVEHIPEDPLMREIARTMSRDRFAELIGPMGNEEIDEDNMDIPQDIAQRLHDHLDAMEKLRESGMMSGTTYHNPS